MKIYIKGHTSPDLDSIASAYTYAEYLRKIKRYGNHEIIPVRVGEPNNETIHIFKEFNIEIPKHLEDYEIEDKDKFILVDHNEESQRHKRVKPEQIVEIVDHHKMNVTFSEPVRIDIKPFGCTNTIIEELFRIANIEPSKETKALMLAAILSDTVGLKSSTTTGYDSEVAHRLAKELNVEIEKLTFDLFKAKSDITGLSAQEIAKKDCKVFELKGNKVFINQVETVEPEKIIEIKEQLLDAIKEIKEQEKVTQAYVVITDILKINSQVIYETEEEKSIIERAFITEGTNNIADIGPKMSRKKDIVPAIENVQ